MRKNRQRRVTEEREESGRASSRGRRCKLREERRINYETIAEFGLGCRVQARTGALLWFNPSGQPSVHTHCSTVETDAIHECSAMRGNHFILN
jgi:hypothetical protein